MSRAWAPKKKTVELTPVVRRSRIRREPAPVVKERVVDPEERDRWMVIVGVVTFALALCVLAVAFGGYLGWSPRQYSVKLSATE